MRHSFAIMITLAAPFVAAQSLSSIPSCALPAAKAGIQQTGCGLSAICICSATSFLETVKQQISTVCSAADQETTINTAQQFCSQAGVPFAFPNPPSPSSSSENPVVSPRDSIDDVLILGLASSSSSSSVTKTSSTSSPIKPSAVSKLSTPSTCPPPTTVTFYTTTTLSDSSSSSSFSASSFTTSPIPSSPISFLPPSPLAAAAAPSIPSAYPPLPFAAAASSSSSSIPPSPITLTSTILTVSSTSTLTLYSTLPSSSPSAAPYAMSNTSFSGINATNTTTAMPFTGEGGRKRIGWATVAVVGVGAVGMVVL